MARSKLSKLKTRAIATGADLVEGAAKKKRKREARKRVERTATQMERRAATRDAREQVDKLDAETGLPSSIRSTVSGATSAAKSALSAGTGAVEVDSPQPTRRTRRKDPVERAGEAAQMGAPIPGATFQPVSNTTRMGEFVTGSGSRERGRDDRGITLGEMAAGAGGEGVDALVTFGSGGDGDMGSLATFDDDGGGGDADPLSVDDPFNLGGER